MDEEKALPKATVQSFIKLILDNQKVSGDFVEKVNEIAGLFIKNLSTEAYNLCLEEKKKTISPEFVFKAIENLGMKSFLEKIKKDHDQYCNDVENKGRSKSKFQFDEERMKELELEQEQLFKASRQLSFIEGQNTESNKEMIVSKDEGQNQRNDEKIQIIQEEVVLENFENVKKVEDKKKEISESSSKNEMEEEKLFGEQEEDQEDYENL